MNTQLPRPDLPIAEGLSHPMSRSWRQWIEKIVTGFGILAGGMLAENVIINAGLPTIITHGLGRPIKGWFYVRGGSLDASETADDNTTLTLTGGVDSGTIALWVF